jgi:small subunit ribosomal protein S17
MAERQTGRRIVEGRVVKAANAKTRVVAIEQLIPHHLYGRFIRRTVKFVAHDEKEESRVGDRVRIQECRPLSRTKRWRLVQIVEKRKAE